MTIHMICKVFQWNKRDRVHTTPGIYRVFFYGVRSLIEPPAFVSYPILFIDPSFSLGGEVQSNEVSIIIVSSRRVE